MFQARNGGDVVAHRNHLPNLLGGDLRRPVFDALLHQRDDVVAGIWQFFQPLLKLAQPALDGPVIDVGTDLQQKAVLNVFVFLPFQLHILLVGLFEKDKQPLAVFLIRRNGAS